MKAVHFYNFGGTDVLRCEHVSLPVYHDHQILVKTYAAGINRIDCKIRDGSSFVAKQLKNHLPSSLGYEFAGVVTSTGKNVTTFAEGDHVLGTAGFPFQPCCYAEYIVTSPDLIIPKPNDLSFVQASTLPLAGLTALQAINLLNIKPGQCILIHAGAGGVGHIAVQLAKLRGATVITTASTDKHSYLNAFKVDHCIDYKTEDFTKVIEQPVDGVIDLIGAEVGLRSLDVLSSDGMMVTIPTITAEKVIHVGKHKKKNVRGLIVEFKMDELSYLAELVDQGQLYVDVFKSFSLEEARTAHQLLESGGVKHGKLALVM